MQGLLVGATNGERLAFHFRLVDSLHQLGWEFPHDSNIPLPPRLSGLGVPVLLRPHIDDLDTAPKVVSCGWILKFRSFFPLHNRFLVLVLVSLRGNPSSGSTPETTSTVVGETTVPRNGEVEELPELQLLHRIRLESSPLALGCQVRTVDGQKLQLTGIVSHAVDTGDQTLLVGV